MAPAPLLSKGQGSLARQWRRLKKRCSSFSSSDAASGLVRCKSMAERLADQTRADHDEEAFVHLQQLHLAAERPQGLLRGKLDQLRRRRSSQGDSISQWWQWQGLPQSETPPPRPSVARSCSLKSAVPHTRNNQHNQQDDDDDDVFVTADAVRSREGVVRSAMIVSAASANPYCTSARRSRPPPPLPNDRFDRTRLEAPLATTLRLRGSEQDQDSGYDGYCPEMSVCSSSSENASVMSSSPEEPGYGHNHNDFVMSHHHHRAPNHRRAEASRASVVHLVSTLQSRSRPLPPPPPPPVPRHAYELPPPLPPRTHRAPQSLPQSHVHSASLPRRKRAVPLGGETRAAARPVHDVSAGQAKVRIARAMSDDASMPPGHGTSSLALLTCRSRRRSRRSLRTPSSARCPAAARVRAISRSRRWRSRRGPAARAWASPLWEEKTARRGRWASTSRPSFPTVRQSDDSSRVSVYIHCHLA